MRHHIRLLINYKLVSTTILLCRNFMGLGSTKMSEIQPVVISPKGRHSASVIFLHGLGDTGHGWAAGFDEIKEDYIKYIFPTAKTNPVTLNGGMPMPSWFDIRSLNFGGPEDVDGIINSSKYLVSLIEKEEKAGIPGERIIIGGFSQGGAVALHAALLSSKKVSGVLALSTWMPVHDQVMKITSPPQFSILQCHGDSDPLVVFAYGKMTADVITNKLKCPNHIFKIYPNMGHSSCDEEMKDVKEFVARILPPV